MLPNEYKPRAVRPVSEIINPGRFMNEGKQRNTEIRMHPTDTLDIIS
jgi:hypothetical protein